MRKLILLTAAIGITFSLAAQKTTSMKENKQITSRKGAPLTLLGNMVSVGDMAPDFKVIDNAGKEVKLSDYKGKTVVITVFPSINTPVCAMQTRKFNEKATSMGDNVVVLTVSRDVPEDLSKFCAAEGIRNIRTLSDKKYGDFGPKYGFLLKEMDLLGRGTVIVDKDGKVVYAEYVSDIVNEPDYQAAIAKLQELSDVYPFALKPLPYKHNALAPHISEETINYHYGKHLQTYVTNLNNLLENSPLKNESLRTIILKSEGPLFNNAAQVFNHVFYFETFSPSPKAAPDGKLLKAIEAKWGSFDKFKSEFVAAAVSVFGSGWAWLVKDDKGELSILKTSNAENPLTKGLIPLMTMDVWEHAYYLDYQNKRADHLASLWPIIDWTVVEERYGK